MVRFCYSKQALARKPRDKEFSIYQRMDNYSQDELSISEVSELCGKGHCWRAGIYDMDKGDVGKDGVIANQVVALDFDQVEHSPQTVVEYAVDLGLPPNFYYWTFSQNPKKVSESTPRLISNLISNVVKTDTFQYKDGFNYRICWVLEREISPREYEQTLATLLCAFARYQPDKATKDCSRMWCGGALGSTLLREEPLPLSAIGSISARNKVKEGVEPRKALKQKKGFIPDFSALEEPDKVRVPARWYEKLSGRCRLWDAWQKGEYLDYNQRLSLFSNLRYLEMNTKQKSVIDNVLSFYNPDTYEGHTCNEGQIRAKFRDKSLKPIPVVKGRGGKYITMPEFFKDNLDIPVVPMLEKVSREELDRWMDEEAPKFLNDKTGNIRILKSQTASGKTERIIRWLLNSGNLGKMKIIYASPRHDNLIEFEERFLVGADFIQKSLIHRCPPKEVSQKDVLYLQLGLPAKTKSAERKSFIDKLFDGESKGVFLITHSLLTALTGLRADLIIIDEEIDSSLIKETKLSLLSLLSIWFILDDDTKLKLNDFIDTLQRWNIDEQGDDINLSFLGNEVAPQLMEQLERYLDMTNETKLAVGFFDYCENDGKISSNREGINYIRIVKKSTLIDESLENGTPVRIFTATPLKERTESYYKTDIDVIEAPRARSDGKIIQYRGCPGSKGMNGDNLKRLAEYIKSKLPDDVINKTPLITFKQRDKSFWKSQGFLLASDGEKQIHLANNSGLDIFKGKNLIVAGKYDMPPDFYKNLWSDIGDGSELTRQNQTIKLNGVEQTLYLYTEPRIRNIQIEIICQAVEQATGRARALREKDATVYVFSNFVIPDADEVFD